jgi:predicted transcriptional regulator
VNHKFVLFQALPDQFDRAKYIEVAAQLQIPESTAEKQITRYINAGLVIRQLQGKYVKKKD